MSCGVKSDSLLRYQIEDTRHGRKDSIVMYIREVALDMTRRDKKGHRSILLWTECVVIAL